MGQLTEAVGLSSFPTGFVPLITFQGPVYQLCTCLPWSLAALCP